MGISTYAQNIIDEKDALIRELVDALEQCVGFIEGCMEGFENDEGVFEPGLTDLEMSPDGSARLSQLRAALARTKQEMGDAD